MEEDQVYKLVINANLNSPRDVFTCQIWRAPQYWLPPFICLNVKLGTVRRVKVYAFKCSLCYLCSIFQQTNDWGGMEGDFPFTWKGQTNAPKQLTQHVLQKCVYQKIVGRGSSYSIKKNSIKIEVKWEMKGNSSITKVGKFSAQLLFNS